MNGRRAVRIFIAFLLGNVLAFDVAWLYRFATTEPNPPIRSCLGWPTPWESFSDWLVNCRMSGLPLLFRYQWNEFFTLIAVALVTSGLLWILLRGQIAFRWSLRLRSLLLAVALASVELTTIQNVWSAVDAWENAQIDKGSFSSLDTWIWGEEL